MNVETRGHFGKSKTRKNEKISQTYLPLKFVATRLCIVKRNKIETGDKPLICKKGQQVKMYSEKQVDEGTKSLRAQVIGELRRAHGGQAW